MSEAWSRAFRPGPCGLWAVFLCAIWVALSPAKARGREVYGLSARDLGLYAGNRFLERWQVPEARQVVDSMLARKPSDPEARALEARVLFFEGRYAESLKALKRLGSSGSFRNLVAATVRASQGFSSRASEHFRVYWSDPKDEVLVGPALETLEAARVALIRSLGFRQKGRVRVEIYPSVSSFTSVSTLTRAEVETSGTIGLCKFDRLMITSPRATLWGYRWRDTLCHEYVHLAVYRLSQGTAPIWVHEGIAKYLEASWRGPPGAIEPASGALLARRMEKDSLIPLDAMSPSVAKLPSAEETALAFAEVETMISFLVKRRGPDALRTLLESMAAGRTDREALEGVWGGTFASFNDAWKAWVKKLPLRRQAVQLMGVELADRGKKEEEPGAIPDPEARDYARLGDMLRARDRPKAAAEEYAKAYARNPGAAGVASRYALGRIALGRFQEALDAASSALELYPDLEVLWLRKGQALAGLGRPAEAEAAFREALEINPFDPSSRTGLLWAARELGDSAEVERQQRAMRVLGMEHPEP